MSRWQRVCDPYEGKPQSKNRRQRFFTQYCDVFLSCTTDMDNIDLTWNNFLK